MPKPWDAEMAQVRALTEDMRLIRSRLRPAMKKVTSKAALNVKNDARARIIAQVERKYVRQYPNSITYTIKESNASVVSAEIGPDKEKPQGALGNLLEFGRSDRPGYPHLVPAWEEEAPKFEDFLGIAAERAVFGSGPS